MISTVIVNSFMERRDYACYKIIKPSNSVLIVTTDEKEYLRLGMLLEQIFRKDTND
jgi:adenine-specific DNA-methyltransferase